MKSVCIAGGSGFIGFNLEHRLHAEGFNVILITREDFRNGILNEKIRNCSMVVNLAGESISGFWTRRKKKRIYDSRVLTTRRIVDAINRSGDHVNLLIQVSGIGIYDHLHIHTEESEHYDTGYLSRVIIDWEKELNVISREELRVVILRLGIVLDKSGGMLKMVLYPLRLKIGVIIKSEDYFPFVQLDDLLNVFMFCIENKKMSGVVNVVAPVLAKISQVFLELFKLRKGKIMISFKRSFIHLLMGESGCMLTQGQGVIPAKLQKEGFVFTCGNIKDALIRACN
jgi:uncharacterized protein (TIGR01777 family)